MRIPSQLNQESLYRPKNQRGKSVESYRRIFRLCLGLVLVLLFMRQAARPTVYQTFFDPSQADNQNVDLPTSREKPAIEANNKDSDPTGSSWSLSAKISKVDREVAGKLTETLRQSDQQLWLKTLLSTISVSCHEKFEQQRATVVEQLFIMSKFLLSDRLVHIKAGNSNSEVQKEFVSIRERCVAIFTERKRWNEAGLLAEQFQDFGGLLQVYQGY